MYSTSVYFYTPRQIVVLNVGNSPRRFNTVYAKTLKLHKGVDNRIQFQFLDQEQKPVNITGKEITIRIIDSTHSTVLVKKALTPILALNGLTELQLSSSELDDVIAQKAHYSVEIPDGAFNLPVFVAGDGGATGMMDIVDSVLPKHSPSMEIGIASHAEPTDTGITYYSDIMGTGYAEKLSIQSFLSSFTGTLTVQGSTTISSPEWYDVYDVTYTDASESYLYSIEGFHPYIRIAINSTQGNVDKILAR